MVAPITTAGWLARFAAAHGTRYTYPPTLNINASRQRVTITCAQHGAFEQTASKHASGQGCPACARIQRGDAQRPSTAQWVENARRVHGDRYDYSTVEYAGDASPVTITCREHGTFAQRAGDHIGGKGCQLCGNARKAAGRQKDAQHFVARARAKHGERYGYDRVQYAHALAKVEITCREHGAFWQTPANHAYGYGCPRCVYGAPSQTEDSLFAFVQSLCPDAQQSVRGLIGRKELDVVVPSRRVAFELNGVYWHSDLRAERDHVAHKHALAEAAGYRLIVITCREWRERRPQFERLVRNALGASAAPKLHARECEVVEVPLAEACAFLDAHHPQQPSGVYHKRYGLKHPAHGLVAVMTFDRGAYARNASTDAQRTAWALTRFATSHQVRGGASKLFRYAQRAIGFATCVSYSMQDWFTGGVYRALGFELARVAPPDYRVYHDRTGFRPKRAWSRKQIPATLRQIGRADLLPYDPATDPRTERDIQDRVFALRVWTGPKLCWEWRAAA